MKTGRREDGKAGRVGRSLRDRRGARGAARPTWLLALLPLPLALVLIAATVVTPGERISRYPRVTTLSDTDLLVAGRTNAAVPTNVGIAALSLLAQATNGLASTGFVNQVGTTVSNGVVNFVTNIVANTSNSLSLSISNTSNFLATSSIDVKTNEDRLILHGMPVAGSQWYVGTNGTPNTNSGQRRGMEFIAAKASLRVGSVGNVGVARHPYIAESNYWEDANVQLGSSILGGSNNLANAVFSTIGGGVGNHIFTNAGASFIGGGTNNYVRTNAYNSVIGGGNFNQIHVDSHSSVIGGGTGHNIGGGSQHVFIGGGQAQSIGGLNFGGQNFAFMGGGVNNTLGDEASGTSEKSVLVGGELNRCNGEWAFLGGGSQNTFSADCDYSSIVGGFGNGMGANPNSGSLYAFIGGGRGNGISDGADSSVIVGGRDNTISGSSDTNAFIGGGFANLIAANCNAGAILAGKNNTVSGSGDFGTTIGNSNTVSAPYAIAIGVTVTNAIAGSVTVGELISYNTPAVIAGAGTGSTNYTLQLTSPEMVLGSSNVNIVAAMGWIDGRTHKWSVSITNLSPDTWGFTFSAVSNRVRWQSWMYGTNAPSVLTNNTLLRITGTSTGTNTLCEFKYFSPAL